MGLASAHFNEPELACRHCGRNEVTHELLAALEALRSIIGKPITVNDAYRCVEHNLAVGGVRNSQHVLGNAADISVKGMTPAQIEVAARRVPLIRGIGRDDYHQYLHIDVRANPAQWCYGVDGWQIPYYAAVAY